MFSCHLIGVDDSLDQIVIIFVVALKFEILTNWIERVIDVVGIADDLVLTLERVVSFGSLELDVSVIALDLKPSRFWKDCPIPGTDLIFHLFQVFCVFCYFFERSGSPSSFSIYHSLKRSFGSLFLLNLPSLMGRMLAHFYSSSSCSYFFGSSPTSFNVCSTS